MTSDYTAGDFLIIRINEPVLSNELSTFLEEYQPAGVHFGADAFVADADYRLWLSTYQQLRNAIHKAVGRKHMIWALDHEGGRVIRAPSPVTRFPYPMNWQENAGAVGHAMGKELKSLGVNLLFGPSLDTPVEAQAGVIGPRAFACDPTAVDEYSNSFITSLKTYGVQTAIKHFPGHGATSCDSHFDLPSLDVPYTKLASRDVQPFIQAFNRGTDCVMFGHLLFRNIDHSHPTSLSSVFHQDILRAKLGFQGVAITDDLDMKSIAENYSAEDIARSVLNNEINFMIFNHSLDHAARVLDKISTVLPERTAKAGIIAKRSKAFIHRLADNDVAKLDANVFATHAKLASQIGERYQISIKDFDGE